MKRMFRLLTKDEIECRVSTVNANGCSVLLYKDARCDMNILDETVGAYNWQREHTRDNKNCIVSILHDERWIKKEDTGTESYTEKEKGLASDSFKRACFNWGIGRELYTAPFIWINLNGDEVFKKGDKYSTYAKFTVSQIDYTEDGSISSVCIIDKHGDVRYGKGSKPPTKTTAPVKKKEGGVERSIKFVKIFQDAGIQVDWQEVIQEYGVKKLGELNDGQFLEIKNKYFKETK